MNTQRLDWDFRYHRPDEAKKKIHITLTEMFHEFALQLDQAIPGDSREKSLAVTKLEESRMWAQAACARNPRPAETV